MPFLPPNKQRQSTEGKFLITPTLLTTGNLILPRASTHLNPALTRTTSDGRMANFSGGSEPKMALEKFVFIYPLPQCAKVIEGYQDPEDDDNEFSANDVIKVTRTHGHSFKLFYRI